jgi:hypothetical protein
MLQFTVAIAQPAAGLPNAPGLLPTALRRRYKVHRIKPTKQKLFHHFWEITYDELVTGQSPVPVKSSVRIKLHIFSLTDTLKVPTLSMKDYLLQYTKYALQLQCYPSLQMHCTENSTRIFPEIKLIPITLTLKIDRETTSGTNISVSKLTISGRLSSSLRICI